MHPYNSTEIDLHAVAMLFDEPLMVVKETASGSTEEAFELTGANRKGMLFVRAQGDTFSPQLRQLQDDIIVKGLQWDIDDCASLEWNETLSWNKLKTKTPVRYLILFGIQPAELGIQRTAVQTYVPFTIENTQVIWSDALELLSADTNRKKKFWVALQSMVIQSP